MKKLIGSIFGITLSLSVLGLGITQYNQQVKAQEQEVLDAEINTLMDELFTDEAENNVGDGQEYSYEITEINGDEIHGIALNNISSDNGGIFLYQNEVSFNVEVGDKIVVVWGEYEDEFLSIEKGGE